MATSYPGALDSFYDPQPDDDMNVVPHNQQHGNANDAIVAIQTALGTNPQNTYANVAAAVAQLITINTSLGTNPQGSFSTVAAALTYLGKASPTTYVSTNATDETSLVQAFLNGLSTGADALLVGNMNISTITISVANVRVRLAPGSQLNKIGSASDVYVSGGTSGPSYTDTVQVTGAGATFESGIINMPGTWDGTNDGSTGINACSVIRVSASKVTVKGVTINNIPKNGIVVSNVDDVQVINNRIYGNFPVGSYTGTNTGHFGIQLDPVASTYGGASLVEGNHIRSCVQGISLANFGAAAPGYGYVINGNTFQGCHNHGIYQQDGVGTAITGNNFYQCQTPIVCSGQSQVVSGNVLYTSTTGGNDDITGISGRDLIDSIIENNTVVGDASSTTVGIAVDSVYGTSLLRNRVSGNIVDLAGTASGKPAIRLGTSTTTTMVGNRIEGNVVSGPGVTGGGLIELMPGGSNYGYGNSVCSNTVRVTGNSHGIYLIQQRACTVNNNNLRNEYSAASATTLVHIYLQSVQTSTVRDNTSVNPSGFGTNCTLRSVQADAGSTGNILGPTNTLYESGLAGSAPLVDSGSGNIHSVLLGGATAAPTTGTWTAGTRLTNTAPAVGSPKGWLCTVGGTPGTWVSEGNL